MTRALPTYWRTCLNCPRTIEATSPDLRCPGCKAKREAALLASERVHRINALGARPASVVERVMRFWDSAYRAQLAGRVPEYLAGNRADRLTRLFVARLFAQPVDTHGETVEMRRAS